jgi:ABC-type sugar transport system substrate-binding protein
MQLTHRSKTALVLTALTWIILGGSGCQPSTAPTSPPDANRELTVGISFETLQTEYWVVSLQAIKEELRQRNIRALEAIADGDANRQLEQIRNFVTRKVDGIIAVPKDRKAILPAVKAANAAGIPVVLFNRPADPGDAHAVAVVADNFTLARDTVAFMVSEAAKTGRKHKAAILVGDLKDINSIGRQDGFDAALRGHEAVVEVVARIPTEWNQEKALAGLVNALQANPQIDFVFSSSDFLFPSVISALKNAGKYRKIGEPGHVILGGFDGDATAYQMLREGYLDATGVQDLYFEAQACVQAVMDLRAGQPVPEVIKDPGFVIHQGNLDALRSRMWGAQVKR